MWLFVAVVTPLPGSGNKTMTAYQVDTYGTVYRSNGSTIGWKGGIGGLTVEYVLKQIINHRKRGESMVITRECDGIQVQARNFEAGMR